MNPKSKFLYHYTKRETLIEFILPSLRLKLNSLKNTNDPKEKKISLFNFIDNVKYAGAYIEIKSKLQDVLDHECKICCFSGDYIDENIEYSGFNLPRMWATYGDNHRGVCLKINLEKFCEENSIDDQTRILKEVEYSSRINHGLTNYSSDLDLNYHKVVNQLIKDNLNTLYFIKHKDWQTEREIRFVSLENKEFCSIKNSLDSILLGMEFNNKYLPSIISQLGKDSITHRVEYDFKKGELILLK
jgi:hypothetical protein